VKLRFEAELWPHEVGASWVFVSLPEDESERIRDLPREPRPGFGSVKVSVTIGATTWLTSIFPQGGGGVYILPVKKVVRAAEGLEVGDVARVELELV
jgi:hypothetical protein